MKNISRGDLMKIIRRGKTGIVYSNSDKKKILKKINVFSDKKLGIIGQKVTTL